MRFFLALACCAVLSAGDIPNLRQLEENHRMFDLRAALQSRGANSAGVGLYRAIVSSRFGAERDAIGRFRDFLATRPDRDGERTAHYELSSAYTRLGDYGQAASEMAAGLRLAGDTEPGRADRENINRMLESLRGVAKPSVEFGPPANLQAHRNQIGLWEIPVEMNSLHAEWIFDSGANFSTVTESEARRMGIAIRDIQGYARDFAGTKIPARLAVAKELRVGPALLHNVVFLVLPDPSPDVPVWIRQIHGILGFPVMRSLECVDISAEGAVTFPKDAPAAPVSPNIFFEGLNPIVQVDHAAHSMQMMLDTGALVSLLYPSVQDTFAQWERDQLAGARTGASNGNTDMVPFIQLELAGRTIYLQRVAMLRKAPEGTTGRDGVLGIDALIGGFRLDFRTMRLTVR